MQVKRKMIKPQVMIVLEEWEAQNLAKILNRINAKQMIHKSEFSLQEKIIGRKLVTALKLLNQPKEQ